MRIESGDYEVLVNEQRTGGTYADLKIAVRGCGEAAQKQCHHVITVRSISAELVVWPPSPADQSLVD